MKVPPSKPSAKAFTIPNAPGMLASHYAPHSPLFLHATKEITMLPYKSGEAYLFFSEKSRAAWAAHNGGTAPANAVLSGPGDNVEAAARLFVCLHALDGLRPACIHAETLPPGGLAEAVNDRLRRAANRYYLDSHDFRR
jgi:L-threonylcarbamoyladenylate synthase